MLFAGRYEVIEEVGRGGMGRVYKVFDQKIKETVALKLINPEIGLNEKAIERFRNELRFARKISHRHVCRLYDLGETGFTHFITMEYVEGEDLKRFIKKSGQLTPAKAVSIARQVCEGLAEAHRLGVIHRDLKPQNIMIDRDGNARIMDFGIARFLEGDGVTASGVMMGTPEYTSPEQNELREVDKRADIYSLGVILFEMVTGRVPFEGETPLSIAMKHKSETPRNPRELNPHVSAALADVIIRCLEKDRKKRYQSADGPAGGSNANRARISDRGKDRSQGRGPAEENHHPGAHPHHCRGCHHRPACFTPPEYFCCSSIHKNAEAHSSADGSSRACDKHRERPQGRDHKSCREEAGT